jgi:cellulase (glycosyl hydrolase family 5)
VTVLRIGRSWIPVLFIIGLRPGSPPLGAEDVVRPAAPPPLPKVTVSKDGSGFVAGGKAPFNPFGVNYFRPGTGWAPQVWRRFDADATRRDFARMKGLGVNCIRVFLSFGSFATRPGALDAEGLGKFDQLLAIAEEAGIYVHPTGPDHWEGLPEWARGDRLADDRVLEALESFWRLLAARYRGRAVIFAYDLLNEPAVGWDGPALKAKWTRWLRERYRSDDELRAAWGARDPALTIDSAPVPAARDSKGDRVLLDYQRFRESIADAWTGRQAAAIREADPAALVTVGLIQWSVPSLLGGVQHYSAFRPSRQARFLDFLEVHFYPFDDGPYTYRDAAQETGNLAYLEGVVREVARARKPVVLAEFGWYGGGKPHFDGGKHPAASEDAQARWCRQAVETTSGLATGWLNWGLYDHPGAGDVTELTGLLAADGATKAWGREFEKLAAALAAGKLHRVVEGERPALDWDLCITSPAEGNAFRERYRAAFLAARSHQE